MTSLAFQQQHQFQNYQEPRQPDGESEENNRALLKCAHAKSKPLTKLTITGHNIPVKL